MLLLHRHKALRAVAATAVAAGIALLVVASLSSGVLHGLADSVLVVLGLPLASFAAGLVVLARRSGVSPLTIAACAIADMPLLWWLGDFVLIQTACGLGRGGCQPDRDRPCAGSVHLGKSKSMDTSTTTPMNKVSATKRRSGRQPS